MNREEFKAAVMAFLERLGLTPWQQPEQALKPIPIEQQPQRHPQQRHPR